VLHTMRWPDEIRRPDFAFLDEDVAVRPQELQMAEALIGSMTGAFDPTEFTDDYREAMAELLEAKQSGGEVQPLPETAESGAAVVDLMSALRRSVEAARGGASAGEAPAERAPAKKATAARKAPRAADEDAAPARRTTARKTAAATERATPAKRSTPARKATAAEKASAAEKATAEKAPAKRARRTA
jgi:DNA end-binding protein Ku